MSPRSAAPARAPIGTRRRGRVARCQLTAVGLWQLILSLLRLHAQALLPLSASFSPRRSGDKWPASKRVVQCYAPVKRRQKLREVSHFLGRVLVQPPREFLVDIALP